MQIVKDKLKAIMEGSEDFPSPAFERNYRTLKAMLISAMRAREGRFKINYLAASDMAWDMAEQMSGEITLTSDDGPDDPGPDQPGWRKTFAIAAVILLTELVIYIVAGQL